MAEDVGFCAVCGDITYGMRDGMGNLICRDCAAKLEE